MKDSYLVAVLGFYPGRMTSSISLGRPNCAGIADRVTLKVEASETVGELLTV